MDLARDADEGIQLTWDDALEEAYRDCSLSLNCLRLAATIRGADSVYGTYRYPGGVEIITWRDLIRRYLYQLTLRLPDERDDFLDRRQP